MRTITWVFLVCSTVIACEDQGARLEDPLTLTVSVVKDSVKEAGLPKVYYWEYFAQANIDANIYSIIATGPPYTGVNGIWWPDPMPLPRGKRMFVGHEFCDSTRYATFRGIRKVSMYGSEIAGQKIYFSRRTEIMIQ